MPEVVVQNFTFGGLAPACCCGSNECCCDQFDKLYLRITMPTLDTGSYPPASYFNEDYDVELNAVEYDGYPSGCYRLGFSGDFGVPSERTVHTPTGSYAEYFSRCHSFIIMCAGGNALGLAIGYGSGPDDGSCADIASFSRYVWDNFTCPFTGACKSGYPYTPNDFCISDEPFV